MSDHDDKKALYARVVSMLGDAELLWRMQDVGFWPDGVGVPEEPAHNADERKQITHELALLRKKSAKAQNPDKALAEERIRRWQESKKRRALAKAERIAKRNERRAEWAIERAATVVHAGVGHSAGLANTQSDPAKLQSRGLPLLSNGADVAKAMGIELSALRWLTYHRRAAAVVHYHRFSIPKKTGGVRAISAPKAALRNAQQWLLAHVLAPLEVEAPAHGFVPGRSVVSNASPHVGRAVVVNMDLEGFFPTLTFRRVKGLFEKLGYSEHVATLFALLCTEPPRAAMELDGKVLHVALSERVLPQGACTSPAITNAICRRMDRRLRGLADTHGFAYTRYADDLTFSGEQPKRVGRLLRSVRTIVADEGFVEHPKKTKVMRQNRRQEVTGVTVNKKIALSRRERRELRAILHNAKKHGLASQNRAGHSNFRSYLRGRVAWVCMLEPERAPMWKAALEAALQS